MIWRSLITLFTKPQAAAVPISWAPYEPVTAVPEDDLRQALMQTGLCRGRDEDITFVQAAIGGNLLAKGIDLRRHGTQIDKPTLKALGVRPSVMLTAEYLAILTRVGLEDPIEAAQSLTSAYLGCIVGTNALGRAEHAGVSMVAVIPNNMAAGPCAACLKMAEKPVPIAMAPTGPLPECPHPTQCVIRCKSIFDLNVST